jgi:hypothetical protein
VETGHGVKLVRHRQTKEPATARLHLNHRATSRLYPFPLLSPFPLPEHRTVKVVCPLEDDRRIPIDVLLAPLMAQVWELGITTRFCCQEAWPRLAMIDFVSVYDVREFLGVAQRRYLVEASVREDQPKGRKYSLFFVNLRVLFP